MQQFIKTQRVLGNLCPSNSTLPHPDEFYYGLFSTAMTLISKKKSPRDCESHRSTLYSNQTKFLELVVKTKEDKEKVSQDSGKISYTGRVEFESQIKLQPVKIVFKEQPVAPQPK